MAAGTTTLPDSWPDTVQVNFNGTKRITEIDVYTLQDAYGTPQEPTETMTFSQYGIIDFDVQYWNGYGLDHRCRAAA